MAPQSSRLRSAPLALINVAVAIRIQLLERGLEARRHQQILEVRVAAGLEELDDLIIILHGVNHFGLLERAAAVGVDHAEDRARRVQELDAELLVRPLRRALAPLLLDLELLDALREAPVDGFLPARETRRRRRWREST